MAIHSIVYNVYTICCRLKISNKLIKILIFMNEKINFKKFKNLSRMKINLLFLFESILPMNDIYNVYIKYILNQNV